MNFVLSDTERFEKIQVNKQGISFSFIYIFS